MAIKVGGTTVIDDSRNISNVGGLKTVNSTSILGSGDIAVGDSTTYGDVGTYVWAYRNSSAYTENITLAGSSLAPAGFHKLDGFNSDSAFADNDDSPVYMTRGSSTLSGTWRSMHRSNRAQSNAMRCGLWVRIS